MRRKQLIMLLILTFLIFPIVAISQGNFKSKIYNDNGQLKIDSTYRISKDQFNIWYMSEDNILTVILKAIKITSISKESGIQGISIISFDCDTFNLNNIRIVKRVGCGLDEDLVSSIEKLSSQIVNEFRHIQSLKKNVPLKYLGTYYIPFDFSIIDLKAETKKRKAIPILEPRLPGLSRWLE